MKCSYFPKCPGCSDWDSTFAETLERKEIRIQRSLQEILKSAVPQVEVVAPLESSVRDRMDFIIENGRMGLSQKGTREVLDLPECLQLSPNLTDLYSHFRKISWPLRKGSVRLRVNASGELWGVWLDFANTDIRDLLAAKEPLTQLLRGLGSQHKVILEMGQRRKRVHELPSSDLKLQDPDLQSWNRSRLGDKTVNLYGLVGGFTQVGHRLNESILQCLQDFLKGKSFSSVFEYGAGNGNLTFPALEFTREVQVLETDLWALRGLQRSAQENWVEERIRILEKPQMGVSECEAWVLNPPRSGAGAFLKTQLPVSKASNLLYMSCYFESFLQDALIIEHSGFKLERLTMIDQFPRTEHFELMSYWSR